MGDLEKTSLLSKKPVLFEQIIEDIWLIFIPKFGRVTPLSRPKNMAVLRPKNMAVLRPKNMAVSRPKMVQWPILNNSHAYPFCKTTPDNDAMANTK